MPVSIIDERLRASLKPQLEFETFSRGRPDPTADSEGNSKGLLPAVNIKGTMGTPSRPDHAVLLAEQRGTLVDKILSVTLETDLLAGDYVTGGNGITFEVVMIDERRLYRRALVQESR